MPFLYHSFIKIFDQSNGKIIKNFEDEVTTNHYQTISKKDFNIDNNNNIEIVINDNLKITTFTSYDALVIMNTYDDGDTVTSTKLQVSNEDGITVFTNIPRCDNIKFIFYYIATYRDGLMKTRDFIDNKGDTISVYKWSVHDITINMVNKNPGWTF